jgi:thiosulfate/3-mercaptopyruvate sulfurtransferase
MKPSPAPPLIRADELAHELAGPRPDRIAPILLDVRWSLAGSDEPGFVAGHLPGARFLDLDRHLAGAAGPGGRHPLPPAESLQAALRALGLTDQSPVVVYDGGSGLSAARAWWVLRWSGLARVRVLDGGLPAWLADPARPTESGPAAPPAAGSVTVRPGAMPTVTVHQVDRAIGSGIDAQGAADHPVLLDVRAAARYRGEVEPLDPVAGHIPGAVNLPIGELMRPDGTYRPAAEIATVLQAVGLTDGTPAIASCGSGVTACQLVLAAELVGRRAALYPGSYSQWCALGRPVATGAGRPGAEV